MREFLHVCNRGTVLRAALVCAGVVMTAPAIAQGKVVRPEVAAGISAPDVAVGAKPATVADQPVPAAPVAVAPTRAEAKAKPAADADAPEPLSERAQAALDRAKSALAAEDAEDFVPEPTPQAKPIAVSQPVKTPDKSASAATKPPVKCLAGCY